MDDADRVAAVGPRLRDLRRQAGTTLAALSRDTGISVSTLSRLEAGQRKPTLELLLPIARAHGIGLDELVTPAPVQDPRVRARAVRTAGRTFVPLSNGPGPLRAHKVVIEGRRRPPVPDPQVHEGYEWLYVLSGRLRLVLAEHDLELGPGEAAEFDTRMPHWFGSADGSAVELLSLFGPQGERAHVRARSRRGSRAT